MQMLNVVLRSAGGCPGEQMLAKAREDSDISLCKTRPAVSTDVIGLWILWKHHEEVHNQSSFPSLLLLPPQSSVNNSLQLKVE